MKTVLHVVRKRNQLAATFINNQISHHIRFRPVVAFRIDSERRSDVIFSDFNEGITPTLRLNENETIWEKILFLFFRKISNRQVLMIQHFIKKHRVDVLHFHYGSDAGIYAPFIKKNRLPTVVSFYGYDCFSFPKRFFGYGMHYLKVRVFRLMDAVLAMTSEMRRDLILIGCPRKKIYIHYHGVPSDLFPALRRGHHSKNKIGLFCLSYLDPVKGHLFLFQSLSCLVKKGILNFELRVAGDGFYRSTLEKYIYHQNLQKYVKFIGSLKYASNEFHYEYNRADIFIHPSVKTKTDKEGVPGAIVEAMFAGLGIISTYHGGIPEVIKNAETGLLVNEWDVEDLTKKIECLIQDDGLRLSLGKAARNYAMKHLDITNRQKQLEKIYNQLLRDKKQ